MKRREVRAIRLEICRDDKDEIVGYLWNALNPLFKKTDGKIMVYMTSDGGRTGNKRAMVINIIGLSKKEIAVEA